jgi:hypothetical protein
MGLLLMGKKNQIKQGIRQMSSVAFLTISPAHQSTGSK